LARRVPFEIHCAYYNIANSDVSNVLFNLLTIACAGRYVV